MVFADIEMELRNIQLQIPKGLQIWPQDLALCALGNQWKQTNKQIKSQKDHPRDWSLLVKCSNDIYTAFYKTVEFTNCFTKHSF